MAGCRLTLETMLLTSPVCSLSVSCKLFRGVAKAGQIHLMLNTRKESVQDKFGGSLQPLVPLFSWIICLGMCNCVHCNWFTCLFLYISEYQIHLEWFSCIVSHTPPLILGIPWLYGFKMPKECQGICIFCSTHYMLSTCKTTTVHFEILEAGGCV